MKTHIIMAWRNLWRNKRRTLITVASIFFGVLLSAYMTSMQEGSYENMVKNVVQFYSGHIQINDSSYWKEKTINNTFEISDSMVASLNKTHHVSISSPRLESFALASNKENSKGVMVLGIKPDTEDKITKVKEKLVKGEYLTDKDNGVLLTKELARYLKLDVKDTLVLVSQGYHGVSAFGKYPVRGIINHPSPELNRSLVYMELSTAQELYSAYNRLTALVIKLDDNDNLSKAQNNLQQKLTSNLKAMNWQEMQPILVQQIESDRAGGVIMKAILYVIIAFGILGTIMMLMAERRRELGVMIAVGMQKFRLAVILIYETLFIGALGVISGIAVSIPLNWYFYLHPIPLSGKTAQTMLEMGFEPVMVFSMAPKIFYHQALTIFVFTLIIGLYPLFTINKMKVIEALRA